MSRRTLVGAAGAILLAVAIALALLGRAVLATPATVDRAAQSWPARARLERTHHSVADRAASSLLAANRDHAFAQIVGVYRNAVSLLAAAGDPRGPVEISRLIPDLHSSQERSQALTMVGTLLAYSAGAGFGAVLPQQVQAPTDTVLAQAIETYRAAVRSDPSNEEAKYDLELLLRQVQSQTQPPQKQGKKRRKTPTTQDKRTKTPAANGQEHHAGIYEIGSGY